MEQITPENMTRLLLKSFETMAGVNQNVAELVKIVLELTNQNKTLQNQVKALELVVFKNKQVTLTA